MIERHRCDILCLCTALKQCSSSRTKLNLHCVKKSAIIYNVLYRVAVCQLMYYFSLNEYVHKTYKVIFIGQ